MIRDDQSLERCQALNQTLGRRQHAGLEPGGRLEAWPHKIDALALLPVVE
jgi:hypothetical protein